jgi:hypothetical protein
MSDEESVVVEKFGSDSGRGTELPARVTRVSLDYNWAAWAVVAILTVGPPVVSVITGDLVGAAVSAVLAIVTIVIGTKVLHLRVE